jgi:hypothetical protein
MSSLSGFIFQKLLVSGCWPLAPGLIMLHIHYFMPDASSEKPEAKDYSTSKRA